MSRVMPPRETARIGVVGLGGMGHKHARLFDDLGHQVAAGADVVGDIRDEFAREFGVETYEAFENMYDDEDIDAVVITTPHAFHAPAAIAAFDRDIHVLVEKPMADTLESAQEMLAAWENSDAIGMVGFCRRFHGSDSMFKALDKTGRFGELRHVETFIVRQRGIPGLGSWFTQKELSGGGAVVDCGVHGIDRALHLLDFPEIREVSAVTRADFGPKGSAYVDVHNWQSSHAIDDIEAFDVEDSASGFIRCADGKSISFEIAWAANRVDPQYKHVVWGTEAGAALTADGLKVVSADDAGVDHWVESELTGELETVGHEAQAELFADSILAGRPPETNTFEQGVAVQRVVDGIYRSSEQDRAIPIED